MRPLADRVDFLEMDMARVARQIAGMPARMALSSGGDGDGKKTAILQATAAIAAASGTPRVPELSADYEFIKGDDPGGADIENWSQVEITEDSYMVTIEIDGDIVIVSAFC